MLMIIFYDIVIIVINRQCSGIIEIPTSQCAVKIAD